MKEFFINAALIVLGISICKTLLMSFLPTRILIIAFIKAAIYLFVVLCFIVAFFRIIFSLQDRFNAYYNNRIYEKKLRKIKSEEYCSNDDRSSQSNRAQENHQKETHRASDNESNKSDQKAQPNVSKSEEEMYADVLGLRKEGLSKESIKSAYRQKMREYHPDRIESFNLGREFKELAEEKSKSINAAYAFLKRRFSV